jgi:hypothetical protein
MSMKCTESAARPSLEATMAHCPTDAPRALAAAAAARADTAATSQAV